MKHLNKLSSEKLPAKAQDETVCGWLFVRSNTKCVDADSILADILKPVAVP
jgi:hypothetical protein